MILKQTEEETESMEDDVWDDTLLIKAYDRAVMLTKERVKEAIIHLCFPLYKYYNMF